MAENEKTRGDAQRSSQANAENIDKTNSPDSAALSPPAFQLKADGSDKPSGQESNANSVNISSGAVQMKKEEEEKSLQLKKDSIQRMESPQEGGGDVMSKMESSFGTSFSDVSIHKESSKASDVGALAYTQGSDIHFAPGQFKPDTGSGQELLGHELTHVVQQREGRVKPTTEVNGMPVNDNKGLEAEADQMGAKAAQGKFIGSSNSESMASGPAQMKSNVIQKSDPNYSVEKQDGFTQKGNETRRDDFKEALETRGNETRGDYRAGLASLNLQVNAVYGSMKAGFSRQMSAFTQAHNNIIGVLGDVAKRKETTAKFVGAFLTLATTFAGGLAGGLMAGVVGKAGGTWLAGQAGISAKLLNESFAGGVIDVLKDVVKGAGGPEAVPGMGASSEGSYQDPLSLKTDGEAAMSGEEQLWRNIISYLDLHETEVSAPQDNGEQCTEGWSPGRVLAQFAEQLANKRAGGEAAMAMADTKQTEIALWKSWIAVNGVDHVVNHGYSSTSTYDEFDVPSEVIDHMQEKLGVNETTVRAWAGFGPDQDTKNRRRISH